MGWFDAFRTSSFDPSGWTTIPYDDARKSSSYSGAMDVGTGVFTAPLAGTYQFIIQACQDPGEVKGDVNIVLDGSTISSIAADDDDYFDFDYCQSTMTGTAITQMQPGQKVWAETKYSLLSNSEGY